MRCDTIGRAFSSRPRPGVPRMTGIVVRGMLPSRSPYPFLFVPLPILVVRCDPEDLLVVLLRDGNGPQLCRIIRWESEWVHERSHVERRTLQPPLVFRVAGPKNAASASPFRLADVALHVRTEVPVVDASTSSWKYLCPLPISQRCAGRILAPRLFFFGQPRSHVPCRHSVDETIDFP